MSMPLTFEQTQELRRISEALFADEMIADTKAMIRRRAMIANQDDPRRGPGQIVRTQWSDNAGVTVVDDAEILTVVDGQVQR